MIDRASIGRLLLAVLAPALIALCCGCGPSSGPSASAASAVGSQDLNGVRCTVKMRPVEPKAMQPFELRIAVSRADAAAVGPVTVELTMGGMTMAPNRPSLSEEGPGAYVTRVTLPMSGEWDLRILTGPGEAPTVFAFPITCR